MNIIKKQTDNCLDIPIVLRKSRFPKISLRGFTSLVVGVIVSISMTGCPAANTIDSGGPVEQENTDITFENYQPAGEPSSQAVQDIISELKSSDPEKQIAAAFKAIEHPEDAEHMVKPLCKMLFQPKLETRYAAQAAFKEMGTVFVEPVGKFLKSKDDGTFKVACEAISAIGEPANKLVPELVDSLSSKSERRRQAAVYALVPLAAFMDEHVQKLEPLLADGENFNTQIFACKVIIAMGDKARSLSKPLINLTEKGNPSASSYAFWALGAIGPLEDVDVTQILIEQLSEFLWAKRQRALKGLAMLEKDAAAATDRVRELMTDPKGNVEPDAAYTLWKITGEADESIKELIGLHELPSHQFLALETLVSMGEAAAPAEKHYLKLLEDGDESIRELAIKGLVNINTKSVIAIEKIQDISENDSDPITRNVAKNALLKIKANN